MQLNTENTASLFIYQDQLTVSEDASSGLKSVSVSRPFFPFVLYDYFM